MLRCSRSTGSGASGAGIAEPLLGYRCHTPQSLGPAEPVAIGPEVEAVLIPVLGLVQVTQAGHVLVGDAEGGATMASSPCGADPLERPRASS